MRYDLTCKVYSLFFSRMFTKYYKKEFPRIKIKPIIKDVKKEYKLMIKRTPSLTSDNLMASNIKGAAYFFAVSKIISNMSSELMDDIVDYIMNSKFMVKLNINKRKKGTIFSKKQQEKWYKDSIRSQCSLDEMDWKYTYQKGNDEIFYNITKCGVCRLAERENCLDYLPCMCRMDYPKYKLVGAKLIRSKTLANHDECCDFHLVRIKESNEEKDR